MRSTYHNLMSLLGFSTEAADSILRTDEESKEALCETLLCDMILDSPEVAPVCANCIYHRRPSGSYEVFCTLDIDGSDVMWPIDKPHDTTCEWCDLGGENE